MFCTQYSIWILHVIDAFAITMIFTVSGKTVLSVSVASVSGCIISVESRAAFPSHLTSHIYGCRLPMRERTGWQVSLPTRLILALFFIPYRTL